MEGGSYLFTVCKDNNCYQCNKIEFIYRTPKKRLYKVFYRMIVYRTKNKNVLSKNVIINL